MIRYQELVPDWYPEKSRDFQVLGRMFDYVLNSTKYNIDSMQNLTDSRRVKDTVLPLLGDKFGIYDKEAYSNRQMLEALPIAIKYKGSLKSINILLNAFLDSMNVFDNAIALYAKDFDTANEISEILDRKIQPYTIVIILSTFPNLTNLHILDVYLKMVIPTGMLVDYSFGIHKKYLDKFKYKEYTFLYYTGDRTYTDEPMTVPIIGLIKNKDEKYSSAFKYEGTTNIRTRKELVSDEELSSITFELKHDAVPVAPETVPKLYRVEISSISGKEIRRIPVAYEPSGVYTFKDLPSNAITYIEYKYNKTKEFVDNLNKDGIDVNAVSIGTIISRDQIMKE